MSVRIARESERDSDRRKRDLIKKKENNEQERASTYIQLPREDAVTAVVVAVVFSRRVISLTKQCVGVTWVGVDVCVCVRV